MEPFKETTGGKVTYNNAYTRPPHVVTNGPYFLKTWDFKRRLILEASPHYWDKASVKSNNLEMVVNDNPLSQFLQYESGHVDWLADVPGDLAAELRAKARTDLRTSPAFGTAFLTFLCQATLPPSVMAGQSDVKNPLADVRVRQALSMAIDRRSIVNTVTRMGELPARTYLPPDGTVRGFTWLPGPFSTARREPYGAEEMRKMLMEPGGLEGDGPGLPSDVARAKQLLADAGYPNGNGFPSLPILYNTGNPNREKIVQILQNQWKQRLNLNMYVKPIEGSVYSDLTSAKDYAIAIVAWYGDYPDASTFTDKYKSDSLQNDADWQNQAFDDLCLAATKEPDEAKRLILLSRAENLIDTEVPIVPLYHYVNISLARDNVKGIKANPRQITIFKHVKVER
jgi:oligopeptide transport system substrate-binding protein